MATPKKTQIVITANAAVAKKVMDELAQRTDAIKQKMAALDVTTKQGQREFKKLEKELVSYNSAISQNIKNTDRIRNAMNNLSGTSLNELKRALSAAKSELGKMSSSSSGLKQMQNNVRTLQAQIDKLTGSVHKQGGAWQTAMKNLTAYVGLFQVFGMVKNLITGVIKKNFEYSGSLTDIRKVSGLTEEQVKSLSKELAKIDTRTSVDALAQLAYQGAKLGMGKYGVDGMKQFVAAADKINVAIGEEMGEKALPALSKMVETMGLIPRMGIEKAMLATGSAMFKLSSTSTATSSNIVEFAKRLTGVSRTAGITMDQLLALGSASDSLFLMPEVSATAMSKFIVALQKNHNLIEKDLGIQQGTIKNMYAAGRAMDAIVLVLEKMRDKGNMNALGGIFKDLGSDGQRLVTAMVTMSKNVDVLKDHLYESQEAFEEATAVTSEYEMQQQSAIGILERANNLWEKAFVNPDGVDSVKDMAQAWYDMSLIMTQSPILKGSLNVSLSLVIFSAKALVALLPVIINFLIAMGVWKTVAFFLELAKATWAAVTAQKALIATSKVNPWVALASVVLTVVGVFSSFANQTREAAEAAKEAERQANAWKDTLGQAAVETANLNKKLANYKKMMSESNLTQEERQRLISRFNKDFRSYIANLGIEIKNVKDLRDHYSELAQEAQRATYYRMMEKAKQQALPKFDEDRNNAANELLKQVRNLGIDKFGVSFSDIDRWVSKGANGNALFWYLVKKMPKEKSGLTEGFDWKIDDKGFVYRKTWDNSKAGPVSDDRLIQFKFRDLLSASRWYANSTNRRKSKEKEIEDDYQKWFPKDYTPYPEETPGTLENDAPDKDAIRREKQEKRDRERAWRDELKQKQTEAKAIIDNFNNYYERQINEKLKQAIALGMDEEERKFFVEPLRVRQNEGAEQLRLAIAGKKNTWDKFKLNTMPQDMLEKADATGVNLSKDLLSDVQGVNVDALRSKLDELGSSLKIPFNSILSEVLARSTKNAQENLSLTAQQKDARHKEALAHNYVGVVKQNMYDSFNTMGYANPNETELLDKAAFDKRKANIIAMFEKAREEITKVYEADVSTEGGRGLLMKILFGDDPDGMAARIKEVLGEDASEWKTFYLKLLQYSDEYDAAQKKRDDERKKLNDYNWGKSNFKRGYDAMQPRMEQEASIKGNYRTIGERMGMQDITANDPELEMLKARMVFAQQYYDFIEKRNATEEQLAEARKNIMSAQASYAQKLTSGMFEQYNNLMSFMGPLNDFGSSVGEAFSTMIDNASEGRKALRSALKQMIKSFATNTLQMISQQQIDRAQTAAHYAQMLLMQQAFGTAQVEGEVATGTAKLGVKAGIDKTEENLEVVHQQLMASLRSAGIFGWCVSTLGPIAGPIAYSAMMSILMGLLSFAISRIGGGDKVSSSASSTKNTKLVSGMLTYDSGNVQDLKPFVGDNGEIYWAREQDKPQGGVNLLTTPTATTINGQRALVAENGPELVIGRETTKAMMMNNPSLLKALVNYDANYSGRNAVRRAFDEGNLAEALGNLSSGASATDGLIADSRAANIALISAINTLMRRLDQPIHAKIDMYGRGNLYESMSKANQFMKGKS